MRSILYLIAVILVIGWILGLVSNYGGNLDPHILFSNCHYCLFVGDYKEVVGRSS